MKNGVMKKMKKLYKEIANHAISIYENSMCMISVFYKVFENAAIN